MRMACIVIGSEITATDNIAEGETGTGTGTETGSMGTGIGSVMATGIKRVTRDEMIGEETMVVVAASASVVGMVKGSSGTSMGRRLVPGVQM